MMTGHIILWWTIHNCVKILMLERQEPWRSRVGDHRRRLMANFNNFHFGGVSGAFLILRGPHKGVCLGSDKGVSFVFPKQRHSCPWARCGITAQPYWFAIPNTAHRKKGRCFWKYNLRHTLFYWSRKCRCHREMVWVTCSYLISYFVDRRSIIVCVDVFTLRKLLI